MSTVRLGAAYQREIYTDFITDSGFLVLAKGLGLFQIVKSLVELYASPKMLVFLLGATPAQEAVLQHLFTGGEEQLVGHVNFKIIKNDTPSKNRMETYLHGGVLSITSRIMLIDLLKKRIPSHMVTGIMLLEAHKIAEFSLEAFIIELFRSHNKVGFVKAFSDRAESLTGGFAKVEKTMKFLKTPKLLLYPRFHATVKSDLDSAVLPVEELYIGMTSKMTMIQFALIEIIESLLNEIIRANPSLDVKEFNSETVITDSFDQQIKRQLDPIWYRVSLKSKQLLGEIKVIRALLEYLVEYDAISYCKFIETIITADASASSTGGFRSYWIMMDIAQSVIQTAKDRVFTLSKRDGTMESTIEKMPKWKSLENTLCNSKGKRVLIMVREEHTKRTLTKILSMGYDDWQKFKYDEYLKWKKKARSQGGLSSGISVSESSAVRRKSKPSRPVLSERLPNEDQINVLDDLQDNDALSFASDLLPENVHIHCYAHYDDYSEILDFLKPEVVVMYEGDLAFIRSLELYSHCTPATGMSVTMLVYNESIEEQLQLLSIRQEKEAFETLIKAKSTMAPLISDAPAEEEDFISTRFLGIVEDSPRTLIIDMRELRSSLPFVLHKHDFILEPVTIDVGDYILSPEICVERKSTSDLISSLNSGRLHSQAEQLCRHYSKPLLLIEFDDTKPFSLLPGDIRADISISDICSKLCLLLLHFPTLKLVWSPSLTATADIFRDLKRDQEDPVLPSSEGVESDPVARDLLLSLPGVTSQNCHILMRHVRDIRALCSRTLNELEDLLGRENASKLYNFLHEPFN